MALFLCSLLQLLMQHLCYVNLSMTIYDLSCLLIVKERNGVPVLLCIYSDLKGDNEMVKVDGVFLSQWLKRCDITADQIVKPRKNSREGSKYFLRALYLLHIADYCSLARRS